MHVIVFCVFYMVLYNSENDTRERNKRREDSSLLFSPLACFLLSRVLSQRRRSVNCQFLRVQITTTLQVLSKKTAGVSSFIVPRIAHRECLRRRQIWVPYGFERRPFVREEHDAWNLSLSRERPTGTVETLDFTIHFGGTAIRIYSR